MGKVKRDNLILVSILGFLVLIIIGLIIGIIIVNNNKPETPLEENNENCYYDEDDDTTVCENDEPAITEAQLIAEVDNIEKEVKKLLSQNPVDTDAINKLYDDGIAKALETNRKDYIIVLSNNRTNAFLSKGLKREALDALQTIDFDLFLAPDQYRFYSKIIELAKELNDSSTLAKYQALQSQVEAEYMADHNGTAEAAKRDAEKDSGPDINDNPDGEVKESE